MDLSAQKEQFSRAYVQAVAAVTGFAWSVPSVDDDSIDMTLSDRGGRGTLRSPKLDLQLKCHASLAPTEPTFSFPIKIKNYDDLRDESVMVPRILVVVLVPERVEEWMSHSEESLALRRCGYWVSLHGLPPTTNTSTVSIEIPRVQCFDPENLAQIMDRIRSGDLP